MSNWKVWRLVVLLVLVGVSGWMLYTRGVVGRMGLGRASGLATEYKTEHDWAIRQISLDIEEMAAFAARRSPRALPQALPKLPWQPEAFVPMAAGLFGDVEKAAQHTILEIYPDLTALDAATLIESSKTVSKLLAANMRNPHAHESAALIVGAFALRDAADWFTDVRWALNRMTAHLAVAQALRGADPLSPDGAVANVILLALSNHQSRALAALGDLGTGAPPEPLNAWVRAMQMRITQDWRTLPDPAAASRLEKLEYFRARRATVRRQRAMPVLAELGEPVAADFARIAQDSVVGVEDGHELIMPVLDLELEEARAAYRRVHNRQMPESLSDALNHRATRLIDGEPHVLPWGSWAEFYQRHIAMNMSMVDSYVRHSLGASARADESKRELESRVGELTMFPVGTLRWTKGSEGTEADLTYLNDIIALASKSPELLAVRAWGFAETGSDFEPVPTRMPKRTEWFGPLTPDVPFEAGVRRGQGFKVAGDAQPLLAAAPHDLPLLIDVARSAKQAAGQHARGLLAHHHDYDLRALDASVGHVDTGTEDLLALQQKACALSSRDCLAVASTLLYWKEDEDAAAREYERALADPEMDAIARAIDSNWLTTYYYRNKQTDKAIALADDVARTGSGAGYATHGRLNERLGNLDEAERDFLANAQRYENTAGLLGFYYRRIEVDRNEAYRHKWDRWLGEVFPNGLQPEPASLTEPPKTGVFVYKDSHYSRKYGVRSGDIIVGFEGWRVDTAEQYHAINAFKDNPELKLTIWRGQLVKIDAKSPTRLLGTTLETHPMKGWIKD